MVEQRRGFIQRGKEALKGLLRPERTVVAPDDAPVYADLVRLGLRPDQLYDADDALRSIGTSVPSSIIFVPPGVSVHRLSNPLTPEQEENFGDTALRAIRRTDIDSTKE